MGAVISAGDASNSQLQNQLNNTIRDLQAKERVQVFKDDEGVRRVLLGKSSNSFYGLKVSKPDIDVFSATDEQLVFNSEQNVFKIVDKGTIEITLDADTATAVEIAHGLSYTPIVLAFFTSDTQYYPLPAIMASTINTTSNMIEIQTWLDAYTDSTNLIIKGQNANATPAGPLSVTYYLLQETAN